MTEKIHRPDDPNRCQKNTDRGQCWNIAAEGCQYCLGHGGKTEMDAKNQVEIKNYRLTIWKARLEEKLNTPDWKNLNEEVGILRIIIEERLNQCKDAHDLIMVSGQVADMIEKLQKTLSTCLKIEKTMNEYLDKGQVIQFASELVEIISDEMPKEKIQTIMGKINLLVERLSIEGVNED